MQPLHFTAVLTSLCLSPSSAYPKPNSTAVGPILKLLSTTEPRTNLEHFTSFFTRYYRSTTGKESSEWLLGKIESYISSASKDVKDRISVKAFPHTWAQTSIIVKFVPESKEGKAAPVTIVGAHCDSTNMLPFLRSPGADDDGSGTVTTLEAFRALVESGYKPETPVEFHWYSAEEGGLLGSQVRYLTPLPFTLRCSDVNNSSLTSSPPVLSTSVFSLRPSPSDTPRKVSRSRP